MKRLRLFMLLALFAPSFASAANPVTQGFQAASGRAQLVTCAGTATECVAMVIGRLVNSVLALAGIALLILMLWGGYAWMTAGGDLDKVKVARQRIYNAVIGIAIVAASYAIANYVVTQLAGLAAVRT